MMVAWVIEAARTSLAINDYYDDGRAILYPFVSLALFDAAQLRDIFLTSTHPNNVNDPLSTIKYELLATLSFLGVRNDIWLMLTQNSLAFAGSCCFEWLYSIKLWSKPTRYCTNGYSRPFPILLFPWCRCLPTSLADSLH